MAVTIKEIAAAAGVSRGTVDRVLHNRGGVKPDVAEKVRKLADTMGYLPNRAGKILAVRKQPIIVGCLIPSLGNVFFDDVIKGIYLAQKELEDFGVTVIVKKIRGYNPPEHIQAIKELVDAGSTALCICTVDIYKVRNYVNQLIDSGIPVVTVNNDLTNTKRLCYIGSDYVKGGQTAAGLLASLCLGHQLNLLIVTGSLKIKGHNQRIQGFSRRLKDYGINYKLIDVFESQDDEKHAYETALKIVRFNQQINCVFIAAAGAAGVCKAIAELDIRKKHPMWIVCFDDVASTQKLILDGMIDFTICQEPIQQGYQAIQSLFNYFVDDKRIVPCNFITNTVIKIRENL